MRRTNALARQLTAGLSSSSSASQGSVGRDAVSALPAEALRKVCLVIGAGDATGGAVAKRFAREGFTTCVVRRKKESLSGLVASIEAAGGAAVAFGCDARKEEEMVRLFDTIERDVGPLAVCIHNIGANVQFDIEETTTRVYEKVWQMAALSAFHTGREAARVMTPRGEGTIIFTGATASVRGKEGFAAFSGAKHAKRALAQSLARELGPKGIHVAHCIVDGPIDTKFIRDIFGSETYAEMKSTDSLLQPDAIADAYWFLHSQPRTAFTFELDLRPWDQTFA